MPTDTGIPTTDIALKWDIIADAPLYVTNPLAMFNALLGGPGFGYVHGTYPDPSAAGTADGLPGGYTPEEWQAMMDNPEQYPDIIDVQDFGDTTYITVTPKVLPLVQPLHGIGLTPLADLIEPALRVIIEETGYDRSIPYGQPTHFRLIPIFNPIELTLDVAAAIPEGIEQALAGLGETTVNAPATPSTLARTANPSTLAALDTADPPASTMPASESDGSVSTQGSGRKPSQPRSPIQRRQTTAGPARPRRIQVPGRQLRRPSKLGRRTRPPPPLRSPSGRRFRARFGRPCARSLI